MKKLSICYTICLTAFICIPCLSIAQNKKKDIRLNRVKSISELFSTTKNGKELTYKENYVLYSKNGIVIEKTDFNPDGSIQKKQTAKLDKDDNVIEETNFVGQSTKKKEKKPKNFDEESSEDLPNESLAKNNRKVYKFDNTNKKAEVTEEIEYNSDGKQIKRITYTYNANGEKSGETHYDESNKKVSSFVYSWNGKSLRTKKEEFDAENKSVSVIRYTYEYY